ncbi:MAG: histidine phosphatase family protein [Saprospiraceae bacterium]|nr:histidine phosphatase family protein [Saprospiraceae bacterium]
MNIYFIRHGETEYNRLGIVQGSGVDTSLNDTGHWQAKAFYEYYRSVPFDLFVSSALRRTHETLAPFLASGKPWIQMPEINEISWGTHEGRPSTPEMIGVYRKMIQEWENGHFDAALPGGESANQLAERVTRFLDWLTLRNEQTVLVCTHGRTLRCLVSLMKGASLHHMEHVHHANTGCYQARWQNAQFHFMMENDTRHLREAAQTA